MVCFLICFACYFVSVIVVPLIKNRIKIKIKAWKAPEVTEQFLLFNLYVSILCSMIYCIFIVKKIPFMGLVSVWYLILVLLYTHRACASVSKMCIICRDIWTIFCGEARTQVMDECYNKVYSMTLDCGIWFFCQFWTFGACLCVIRNNRWQCIQYDEWCCSVSRDWCAIYVRLLYTQSNDLGHVFLF